MGLDMYLYADKYIGGSEYSSDADQLLFRNIVQTLGAESLISERLPSVTVSFQVGYWRKSNQIHQWFVDNCQDGVDDCRNSYVSRDTLVELLGLCVQVAINHELASQLLPVSSGFFFGGEEYDEWYFQDINNTVDMLTKILATATDDYEFSYQSSW